MGTGEKSRSMELHSGINHMIPFLGAEIIRPIPIIFTDGGLGYPHILNTWVLDGLGQRNWLVFFRQNVQYTVFFLKKIEMALPIVNHVGMGWKIIVSLVFGDVWQLPIHFHSQV